MPDISNEILIDIVDVLIVSFLLYKLFTLMRGTRAVHMFFGLVILFILSVVAQWAHLMARSSLSPQPEHRLLSQSGSLCLSVSSVCEKNG